MSKLSQQSNSSDSVQEIIATGYVSPNVVTTNTGPSDELEMTPQTMTWEDTVEVIDLKPEKEESDIERADHSLVTEVENDQRKNMELVPVPRVRSAATKSESRVNLRKPSEPPKPHPRSNKSHAEVASHQETKFTKEVPTPSSSHHSVKDFMSQGSRRPSVGDWSIESGRTSQSDNRSYRERLKERIQTVKERAGTSVTKARLRHFGKYNKSPGVSRIQELLHKEETDIEKALEKHEEMKVKWRVAAQLSLEASESYDFFTKMWDTKEDKSKTILQEPAVESPSPSKDTSSNGEQTKILTKDYLGIPDEWQIVDPYVKPTKDDPTVLESKTQEILFVPSDKPLPVEEKLGPDCEPRFIEDEGLYVGPKPTVHSKAYNRLQHRLIATGNRKWFEEDGEILALPDPRITVSCQLDQSDVCTDIQNAVQYKPAVMMKIGEGVTAEEMCDDKTYLLELEIGEICWHHHPLFSHEHVAAQRLRQKFEDYTARVETGIGRRLAGKLQALRIARDNLCKVLQDESNENYTEKLNKYKEQIKDIREQRLKEGCKDRKVVLDVLAAWRDLRNLRNEQGYAVTPEKINIVELDDDDLTFGLHDEWNYEKTNQLKELQEEMEEEHQKTHGKDTGMDSSKDPSKDDSEEEELNRNDLKSQVMKNLKESLRPPGEPVIVLTMTEEHISPDSEIKNQLELQRRSAVKRCTVSVRILFNKQEVCQSNSHTLGPQFIVSINQRFCIRILQWPQTLTIEILQEGGGVGNASKCVAQIYVPIPSTTMTLENSPFDSFEFSNEEKYGPYRHTGVGSGLLKDTHTVLITGGILRCKVGWGQKNGEILSPPEKYLPTHKYRKELTSVSDSDKIREWATSAQLDPNDPNNAAIFEFLKTSQHKDDNKTGYLQLNPLESQFYFCSDEDIINDPRLRLLRLRDRDVPEFRGLRGIPLKNREIPSDIFKVYEKRIKSPARNIPAVGETTIEWQRECGRHQLSVLRDTIVSQCKQAQQLRALRDIVIEDQVPDIGTLGLTFMKWLQPKRPLRPTRKERKKVPVKSLVGQEVELIINVVRAFEVPVRTDTDPVAEGELPLIPVRPFVEVSFQGQRKRTTTAEGANPTWNQDLHIPVKPPEGGLTPGGLQNIQDKLYCNLFDETVIDLLEDDRQRETNIHQRLQRHWLGSLVIPFSSLYANSRIEGTFQLYSPPVLLSYDRETHCRQYGTLFSDTSRLRDSTFLTVFITVHPPLHHPEPFKERLPCSEAPYLEEHLESWQGQVQNQFPHRPVKTLVVDVSAQSVCVTRFFRPLDLPVIDEGEPTKAEMVAQFVSKIPIVDGSMLFPGLFDVWLTAEQVLNLLTGDSEDHAVLLCCYFMKLGIKCWLLLGCGIPHGATAYVLTKDDEGEFHIWDPPSGNKYSVTDSFCPLHKVYCLINQDNIWANTQREEVISRTRFDVTRHSDWWPAFGRNVGAPLGSVQPEHIEYNVPPTLKTDVSLLQDKLEKILRESITKWRPTARTVWNRYVTVTLRNLLPSLERATWTNSHLSTASDHIQKLSHSLGSHKVCGFPLNFAYTTTQDIVEAVRATGVHSNESTDVEFALAVYIHPFPYNVLSVWVYIASLNLRR